MEELRPDALQAVAARVVAWHNRHPLARRITAEQVQSVGYVALPYLPPAAGAATSPNPGAPVAEAPAGGTLRERAMARAKPATDEAETTAPASKAGRRLQAAFTEDFIAPLSPRRVGRWAARHGVALEAAPRGAPLRQVEPDAAFASQARALQTLYVLTAMVESRGKRVRMLLSPSSDTAVLGGRLWSLPRVAGGSVVALGSLAALTLAVALWWPPAAAPVATPSTSATGVTQTLPRAVEATASMPAVPSIKPRSMRAAAMADAGLVQPAGAASAATQAAPAAPPADVEPTLGRIALPSLGLPRGDEARAAARERRMAPSPTHSEPDPPAAQPAAPAAAGAQHASLPSAAPASAVAKVLSAPAASSPPAPGLPKKAELASGPASLAAPPPGHAFALSSRRLRTRAESEQTMAAIKSLLAGAGHPALQVEVVPAEDDWRVVGWPFAQRAQAEKARALLASRGIRLEVIDF